MVSMVKLATKPGENCCAPTETSIEGACCLEITDICKRRFSSRFSRRFNVCRLDPHFLL